MRQFEAVPITISTCVTRVTPSFLGDLMVAFYRNLFIGLASIIITTYYSKCSEPLEKEVIV